MFWYWYVLKVWGIYRLSSTLNFGQFVSSFADWVSQPSKNWKVVISFNKILPLCPELRDGEKKVLVSIPGVLTGHLPPLLLTNLQHHLSHPEGWSWGRGRAELRVELISSTAVSPGNTLWCISKWLVLYVFGMLPDISNQFYGQIVQKIWVLAKKILKIWWNSISKCAKTAKLRGISFATTWTKVAQIFYGCVSAFSVVCAYPFVLGFSPDNLEFQSAVNGAHLHSTRFPELKLLSAKVFGN